MEVNEVVVQMVVVLAAGSKKIFRAHVVFAPSTLAGD